MCVPCVFHMCSMFMPYLCIPHAFHVYDHLYDITQVFHVYSICIPCVCHTSATYELALRSGHMFMSAIYYIDLGDLLALCCQGHAGSHAAGEEEACALGSPEPGHRQRVQRRRDHGPAHGPARGRLGRGAAVPRAGGIRHSRPGLAALDASDRLRVWGFAQH